MGCFILAEITVGTYLRGSLSTIERRFQLSSTTLALFTSCSQLGTLIVLPFVSFFGSHYNRPRVLAYGSLLVVIGYIFVVLPHFLTGEYEYTEISSSNSTSNNTSSQQALVCTKNTTLTPSSGDCSDSDNGETSSMFMLMVVGMVMVGIGGAAISPLGVSYMDDHSNRHDAAIYVGIMQSIALVGPVLGFTLCSYMLKIYVDFLTTDTSTLDITPKSSSWVGAWWLGVIINIVFLLVFHLTFWFFPKKMNFQIKKEEQIEAQKNLDEKPAKKEKVNLKSFVRATKRLLTNKVYIMVVILWTTKAAEISGVITFKTKYIENVFGQTAGRSSFYIGMIVGPFLIVGTVCGAIFTKCMKLNFRGMVYNVGITRVMIIVSYVVIMYTGCTPNKIAGFNVAYQNQTSELLTPTTTCNTGCSCPNMTYYPVCDDVTGITYITPCHAGCTDYQYGDDGKVKNFTSCSCVGGGEMAGKVSAGRCDVDSDCDASMWKALVLLGLGSLFNGFAANTSYMLLLRSIDPKDKAFGLGIALLAVRCLGWIPTPVIFGKFIDKSCSLWTQKECSSRVYCSVYDVVMFRTSFFAMLLVICVAEVIVCFVLNITGRKRMRKIEKKADEEEEKLKMITRGGNKEEIEKFDSSL